MDFFGVFFPTFSLLFLDQTRERKREKRERKSLVGFWWRVFFFLRMSSWLQNYKDRKSLILPISTPPKTLPSNDLEDKEPHNEPPTEVSSEEEGHLIRNLKPAPPPHYLHRSNTEMKTFFDSTEPILNRNPDENPDLGVLGIGNRGRSVGVVDVGGHSATLVGGQGTVGQQRGGRVETGERVERGRVIDRGRERERARILRNRGGGGVVVVSPTDVSPVGSPTNEFISASNKRRTRKRKGDDGVVGVNDVGSGGAGSFSSPSPSPREKRTNERRKISEATSGGTRSGTRSGTTTAAATTTTPSTTTTASGVPSGTTPGSGKKRQMVMNWSKTSAMPEDEEQGSPEMLPREVLFFFFFIFFCKTIYFF